MNRRKLLLGAASLAACARPASGQAPTPFPMRRGVNLGNALEAPNEGDWGYRIEPAHLEAIASAGFDGIRLPVRWDAHASARAPYTIARDFFARVDQVIEHALALDLYVQLDAHHYAALIEHPRAERARLLAIWRQISERYTDHADRLMFEPLNEPHGDHWDGARLTDLQAEVVAVVRESNPTRLVVLGPGNWQNIDALARWRPPSGANLAVSVHYYEPHAFTHQNAEWLGADAPRFDRVWGADGDRAAVAAHIAQAANWARTNGYAIQLGEFGVNTRVPLAQRVAWTRCVREACESHAMAWCAWDFAGAFAVWDRESGRYDAPLRDALLAPQ
ncbi:MAG: glycoside hydrolase family 5 protein [Hyphomonadaceae bacterium]